MNKHIKELAARAVEETQLMMIMEYKNFESKLYEKFAELIVAECMDCSLWVGKVNKNAVEPIHTAHAINLRIKKHFGVKE